ncbi:TonB-dependent receptor [Corallincola spongiicola]|uniref:TonB-dependent receptor n=1 Tax=Corallincola spongiicola TaxID=2520508 RepID=A0ABY1WM09_9GAMM|nr:TonB-dependent receptor [Corallincola spongiicola]TAA42638.1 TonB-dependent receptor [Corallincola spongiicola]
MPIAKFKRSAVCVAIAGVLHTPVYAEDEPNLDDTEGLERISVTASRRVNTVQEIPLNITALGGDQLADNRITDLVDVAKWVPGLNVVDQGGRGPDQIIVRGLNTSSLGPTTSNSGGGTVGTYVGEIPVYVDLFLNDMERVEVLIGPQGTLYGAGTLAGAIRYIPVKPQFDAYEANITGGVSQTSHADDMNYESHFVFNFPLGEDFAFRGSMGYVEESGFIDYNYIVREPGVSNPQPDFSNPTDVSTNLRKQADNNGNETVYGRASLRWSPISELDSTLNYYYQKEKPEGRSLVHTAAFNTGKYENAYRFEEPNEVKNQLISLELSYDLGFAELVSATGYSKYDEEGQRDQTDLLLDFEYGYEDFPSFAAFTREIGEEKTLTQELRLVSTDEGPFSWIVGAYYNKFENDATSEEFVPGLPEFWDVNRPDNLEYYSVLDQELTEKALFGEVTFGLTDQLSLTLGGRYYDYEDDVTQGFDLPLLNTIYGAGPDDINPDLVSANATDDGTLLKGNLAYQYDEDVLIYATYSEGYRIGGVNAVAECQPDQNQGQNLCALPNEVLILPDETNNYEIGLHSALLDNTLELNAALYYIEWKDLQVDGRTENGGLPITINGSEAMSRGVETSARYLLTDEVIVYGTYAYTNAELTEDAAGIGEDGDRLPGSPEHQFSAGATYKTEVWNGKQLEIGYTMTAQSDILTKTGERDFGESLAGYAIHNLSAKLSFDDWIVTLYADNFTDKYALTSVREDYSKIRQVGDFDLRRYGHYVNEPRTVGLNVTYFFGD